MAQWWGPKGFTNPFCELDARPGGAIRIHMRAPDGVVFPMTGRFREVAEPERLVFTRLRRTTKAKPLLEASRPLPLSSRAARLKSLCTECDRSCSRGAPDARWDGSWLDAKPRKARRYVARRKGGQQAFACRSTLLPSVRVLLPEGACRALRERHAVRAASSSISATKPRARRSRRSGRSARCRCCVTTRETARSPSSSIIIEYLAQHYPGRTELVPSDAELARQTRLRDRFYDLYVPVPMQKIVTDRLRPAGKNDSVWRGGGKEAAADRLSA